MNLSLFTDFLFFPFGTSVHIYTNKESEGFTGWRMTDVLLSHFLTPEKTNGISYITS